MNQIKAVAALDSARGLGIQGDLPWYLPEDLKHFARTTTATSDAAKQNAVIMGRVTAETIPPKYWPLRDRKNVVITRNPSYSIDGAAVFHQLEEAIAEVGPTVETVFIVGGGQIYSLALPLCTELILTQIDREYGCDAFFPEYDHLFSLEEEFGRGEHEGVTYRFQRWVRKP